MNEKDIHQVCSAIGRSQNQGAGEVDWRECDSDRFSGVEFSIRLVDGSDIRSIIDAIAAQGKYIESLSIMYHKYDGEYWAYLSIFVPSEPFGNSVFI